MTVRQSGIGVRGCIVRLFARLTLMLALAAVATPQPAFGQSTPTPAPLPDGWTTLHLSQARQRPAVATIGQRVVFAGGSIGPALPFQPSDAVDIYDDETGTWSTAQLSEPRQVKTLATVGDLVF